MRHVSASSLSGACPEGGSTARTRAQMAPACKQLTSSDRRRRRACVFRIRARAVRRCRLIRMRMTGDKKFRKGEKLPAYVQKALDDISGNAESLLGD